MKVQGNQKVLVVFDNQNQEVVHKTSLTASP